MELSKLITDHEAEKAENNNLDAERALAFGMAALNHLNHNEQEWITNYDALKVAEIEQHGFDEFLSERNAHVEKLFDNVGRIVFPNKTLAVLWCFEIEGQISDGHWENAGIDWKTYTHATVRVNRALDEPEFDLQKNVRTLDFSELTEFDGLAGRMRFHALASGVTAKYSRDDLEHDLTLLSQANKEQLRL